MTELKYDPELPYAHVGGDNLWARFKHQSDADVFRERVGVGEVIDTTPKPKIPEDATYIFVEDWDQSVFAFRADEDLMWLMVGNGPVTQEELLEYIGDDAEVTVLVRKEDS